MRLRFLKNVHDSVEMSIDSVNNEVKTQPSVADTFAVNVRALNTDINCIDDVDNYKVWMAYYSLLGQMTIYENGDIVVVSSASDISTALAIKSHLINKTSKLVTEDDRAKFAALYRTIVDNGSVDVSEKRFFGDLDSTFKHVKHGYQRVLLLLASGVDILITHDKTSGRAMPNPDAAFITYAMENANMSLVQIMSLSNDTVITGVYKDKMFYPLISCKPCAYVIRIKDNRAHLLDKWGTIVAGYAHKLEYMNHKLMIAADYGFKVAIDKPRANITISTALVKDQKNVDKKFQKLQNKLKQ